MGELSTKKEQRCLALIYFLQEFVVETKTTENCPVFLSSAVVVQRFHVSAELEMVRGVTGAIYRGNYGPIRW